MVELKSPSYPLSAVRRDIMVEMNTAPSFKRR